MKFQFVLKKINSHIQIIKSSPAWQKMFVHRIDEEKMQEYKNQYRQLGAGIQFL